MSVKQAGEFHLWELEDGGVAIAIGGVDIFYADDFQEADLFVTMLEGLPMIAGISGFLSKRLFSRRESRELEGAHVEIESSELEAAELEP